MQRTIAQALRHVYWIGGSPCAGKSSVAEALAERYDMASYNCDAAFEIHEKTVDPERFPTLSRLSRLSCNDLWMRPVPQQVSEEIALYDEEFSLILDDLRALPTDRPVIAEGAALLPHLLHDLGIDAHRTLWMVPTPQFQREHYTRREWRHDVLAACADPAQAWHNWMERDIGFARAVCNEATALNRRCIVVDGAQSLSATLEEARRHFRLPVTPPDSA